MDSSGRIIYKSPTGRLYITQNGKKRYNPIKRYRWYLSPTGTIIKHDLLETVQKKYGPFHKKHPRIKMSVFTKSLKRLAPTDRKKNNVDALEKIIRKFKKGLIVGKGGKTMYTPLTTRKKRKTSVKGPRVSPPNNKPKIETNNNILSQMMASTRIKNV
jgi:hypothetical protein